MMNETEFITKAKRKVAIYTEKHFADMVEKDPAYDIYTVWLCKTLQNSKGLFSTSLNDSMYYEVTYDGDKKRFYFDAYEKKENICEEDK